MNTFMFEFIRIFYTIGVATLFFTIYTLIRKKIYKKKKNQDGIINERIRVEKIFNDMFEKEKEKIISEIKK